MKTKLLLPLFFAIVFVLSVKLNAQQVNCEWVNYSSIKSSCVTIVDNDRQNNTTVCGAFGSIAFGSDTINTNCNGGGFLSKYNTNGNLLWYKIFEANGGCFIQSMVTNDIGEVYALVSFSGTIFIDSISFIGPSSPNSNNLILTKYSQNGSLIFAKKLSSNENIEGIGINLDLYDNILLLWSNISTTTISNTNIGGSGRYKIAKIDSSGQLKWAMCLNPKIMVIAGMTNQSFSNAADNSILLTGNYKDTMVWGSSQLYNPIPNEGCGFTAKLDSNGNEIWAKKVGSTYFQGSYITNDHLNNIYNCGIILSTQHFSVSDSVYIASGSKWVMVHQDLNGNYINNIQFPSSYWIRDIKINGLYLYLAFEVYVNHPNFSTTTDAIICKYDLNMNFIDSVRFTSINIKPMSIDFDLNGKVLMGGVFQDSANIGNCTFATNDTYDDAFYVSKFAWNSTVNANTPVKNDDFRIFPNPANSFIQIVDNSNSLDECQFQVLDFYGKKVYESIISNSTNTIDISDLKSGVYIIIIQNNTQIHYKKIIKI